MRTRIFTIHAAKARGAGNPDYVYQDHGIPDVTLPRDRSKERNKAAKAAQREREAVADLLRTEQQRLDVLKQTDPVMKEMIQHREVLKHATDAERKAVEELIRKRQEEQEAIDATTEAGDFLKSQAGDLIAGLVQGGDAAADAWDRVKQSILAAALEATLLGSGPLAGVFGTSGGGLIEFGLNAIGLADGGYVTGTGGDRSDKIPIMGSAGEFMVNAMATRKHRHLLEAINAGADIAAMMPRLALANGGPIGAGPVLPATTGSAGDVPLVRVQILPSSMFRTVVDETSARSCR